jgi:hypothetical protein
VIDLTRKDMIVEDIYGDNMIAWADPVNKVITVTYPADSSPARFSVPKKYGQFGNIRFSPDGKKIAYAAAIVYRGVWDGKPFEDKGSVLEIDPPHRLVSSYYSAFSGLSDVPENYQRVTYTLVEEGAGTHLVVAQDNIATEESRTHSEGNWNLVLENLKKVVENQ